MKKFLSVILSFTTAIIPMSALSVCGDKINASIVVNAEEIQSVNSSLTGADALPVAMSLQSDIPADSSCYSFDSKTGELTLKGNVEANIIRFLDTNPVKSIKAEKGTVLPQDSSFLFSDYDRCTSIDFSNIDTSNVTNMSYMFLHCTSLTHLDISSFDTSNVTDMKGVFGACNLLDELVLGDKFTEVTEEFGLSNSYEWANSDDPSISVGGNGEFAAFKNTGTNTYIHPVVDDDSSTNNIITSDCYTFDKKTGQLTLKGNVEWEDLSTVDTKAVKSIKAEKGTVFPEDSSFLFAGYTVCSRIDFSDVDTSKVKDMTNMFGECMNLTEIDLSGFDTSNVTIMTGMFSCCYKLESVDLSSFNIGNVTSMCSLFYNCKSLKSVDLSSFDTENTKDISSMFSCCYDLTSVDLSSFNTRNVTNMEAMFYDCEDLESLDLSSFDTSNVKHIDRIFYYCNSLSKLTLGDKFSEITEECSLPNWPQWENSQNPSVVVSGNDDNAVIKNIGNNIYIREIAEEDESDSATEDETTTTTTSTTTTSAVTIKITANTTQTTAVDYDSDLFFIVVGHYVGEGGITEEYTQLKCFNRDYENGWLGGDKVVWRDAPSDIAYGDIFIPDNDSSMILSDSVFSIYPSSYYWDLADGTKLKKVGNCSDIMEQKVLTGTKFDYLAHMWYGKDFTDGEKTYRYSENHFGSDYGVSVCYSNYNTVRFAVYGDTLLLPLAVIDDDEETTETTTTTTTMATSTTTTTETTDVTTSSTTSEIYQQTWTAPPQKEFKGVNSYPTETIYSEGSSLDFSGLELEYAYKTHYESVNNMWSDTRTSIAEFSPDINSVSVVAEDGTEFAGKDFSTLPVGKYTVKVLQRLSGWDEPNDFYTNEVIVNFSYDVEIVEKGNVNFFAPIGRWGEMAILDYESRKGISAEESVINTKENSDGTYSITLKDDKGEVLATYTIDPETGKGTDDSGEAVDLPQTGNNSVKTGVILSIAVLLVLIGTLAIYGSGMIRRKNKR